MILIPVSEISGSNFWYDHGVSLISAIVTFLAFVLTFGTLIYNSRKEKREAEDRSKKTLSVLDFIFDNKNGEVREILKEMKYIKENADEGIHERYKSRYEPHIIEEWKKNRNRDLELFYVIKIEDFNPLQYPSWGTRFEKNHIVLITYEKLFKKKLEIILGYYLQELKTNLQNQHLNITSDSLEKISYKIDAIKKSLAIYKSIQHKTLKEISYHERDKTDEEIEKMYNDTPLNIINKEYEKVLNLEKELEKVVRPLVF